MLNKPPKEIEFKYDAKNIFLPIFLNKCKKILKTNFQCFQGTDRFYGSEKDKRSLLRHRVGSDMNQLTFKKKLIDANNYVRIEHNIDLPKNVTITQIHKFCNDLGYKYNFMLNKNVFLFKGKNFIIVYYICYDEDNRAVGRFIEIELDETIDWGTQKNALKELRKLEKKFMLLGIGPRSRVKPSLWELYKNKQEKKNNGIAKSKSHK